jgi:LysR family transcriptional regulator, transcriptional activator of the cysJI operon
VITTHLLVFVTVAEKKNFSRAAEALSLTQPAISQQVHTLEEYYGTKLFERTSKRVELTHAGETLFPYAKKILELEALGKDAIHDLMGKVTGKLTIGATLTIGEYMLPHLIAEYTRRFPEVEVNVLVHNTEEIQEMALSHSLDIGMVEGRIEHRNLTMTPFLEDEMVLIAPIEHPLTAKETVTCEDLQTETYILREEGSGTRMIAEEVMQAIGFTPTRTFSFGSTQSMKEAVEAGMGLAILSKWCIRKELRFGTLAQLKPEHFTFTRPLCLLERAGHVQTRALTEFIALVHSYPYKSE